VLLGLTEVLPEAATDPILLMETEVALVVDHERELLPPRLIVLGVAEKLLMVGCG
jgi:hypothetical protein